MSGDFERVFSKVLFMDKCIAIPPLRRVKWAAVVSILKNIF